MTEILKIENCKIEFTPKFSSNNCEIKLISGYSNEVFFDTKFEKYEENNSFSFSKSNVNKTVTIESIKKLFILSLLYENFLKNPPNINCKQAPNNKILLDIKKLITILNSLF